MLNISFEELIHGSYSNPEDWFLDFHEWFHGLPLLNQIVTVVLMILIAVGVIALTYYILKGTAYLVYYIFKGIGYLIYYLFKGLYYMFKFMFYDIPMSIAGMGVREYPKRMEDGLPSQVNYDEGIKQKKEGFKTVSENQPSPNPYQMPKIPKTIHCPVCGEKFTSEMQHILKANAKVYCEYCGHSLEMVVR